MKVLLVIPPMTQVNTPYPATAYLTAFLESKKYDVTQRDLGIDLVDQLLSKSGLNSIKGELEKRFGRTKEIPACVRFFLETFNDYASCIDPVMQFLRGKNPTLALRLAARLLVPEGPRFLPLSEHAELLELFGEMGLQDKAKYIASLFIDDIADVIKLGVDERFEFSRYAEALASSQTSFTPLANDLDHPPTLVDRLIQEITASYIKEIEPHVVGLTLPFPGNVYGGLRCAQEIKRIKPSTKIVIGGGFVNTELRELNDPRLFQFVDYAVYDDGERPLECLLEHLSGKREESKLLRTRLLKDGRVTFISNSEIKDVAFKDTSAPTYKGLPLEKYFSMVEMPNPMHRMWSDFRWNKLILAHGCYWKKCTFCDVNLDYIGRFEPGKAETLVDNMEKLIAETGQTGFHFVDEAAPPALLKSLSEVILKRGLKVSWWGNLRFDKQFTPEVATLMADAGCVAVTGGLEVASARVLELINKGITVEQVAKVTKAFTDAGIYVHAYLMYGYPTQTAQETVDSLEVVRQLFQHGCLHSAHWHRFICTTHSPVGKNPKKFGIVLKPRPEPEEGYFAVNEIPYVDSVDCDHDRLGIGLRKALYNYMHGIGIDQDVRKWFGRGAPDTTIGPNLIKRALR